MSRSTCCILTPARPMRSSGISRAGPVRAATTKLGGPPRGAGIREKPRQAVLADIARRASPSACFDAASRRFQAERLLHAPRAKRPRWRRLLPLPHSRQDWPLSVFWASPWPLFKALHSPSWMPKRSHNIAQCSAVFLVRGHPHHDETEALSAFGLRARHFHKGTSGVRRGNGQSDKTGVPLWPSGNVANQKFFLPKAFRVS